MIIHLASVDRKAALLAGHELGQQPTMEASPADFGEDWPRVVKQLTVANDGTATFYRTVSAPTPEAVIAAVKAEEIKAEQDWAAVVAQADVALAAWAAVLTAPFADLLVTSQRVYDPEASGVCIGEVQGVGMPPGINAPIRSDTRVREDRRNDPLWTRLHEAKEAAEDRISAENRTRREAALPALRIEFAAKEEARKVRLREEEATKQAAITERAKERLSTGYWERETASYNERREGKPWCAKVTGIDSRGKLIYEWAEWSGRIGERGLLRAACKPGEIIAWGQKDNRRPDKSEHHILQMRDDGRMTELSVPEAVKALRAAQA
jgi:hypothetical protein